MNAVIFDFNGVIVDDEPQHMRAFATVLKTQGVELTEASYFERYLGFDDRDLFRRVLADHGRTPSTDEVAALVADKAEAYLRELEGGFELCAGAADLVQACAKRYPLAIGSGARHHEIVLILERSGLDDCIDVIVSADDVSAGKPDPETYQKAFDVLCSRHAGLRPEDCVVIEDAPNGIRAARGAGMRTIAVCASRSRADLAEADRIVDSLADLSASDLFPG